MERDGRRDGAALEFATRTIAAGPVRFVVASNDRDVCERFDALFASFPAADAESRGVDELRVAVIREEGAGASSRFVSDDGGQVLGTSSGLAEQELLVSRLLNERKLDAEPDLLHLHSAAVARDGRAVVLLGRSGAGKSTLTAALVRAGWAYVADEQVTIAPETIDVFAYPRPLTLRRVVWNHFSGVEGVPAPRPDDVEWQVEVAPSALGAVHEAARSTPVVVVLPAHDVTAEEGIERVATAGEAVERLASCCYDLDRVGLEGFEALVRIAAACDAWRLAFSELAPAVAAVDDAFAAASDRAPLTVEHDPPHGVTDALAPGTVRRSATAHAWSFGDGSTVVYDPPTRKVTFFDAAGGAAWRALTLPVARDDLVTGSARDAAAAWLRTLAATGLVADGDATD